MSKRHRRRAQRAVYAKDQTPVTSVQPERKIRYEAVARASANPNPPRPLEIPKPPPGVLPDGVGGMAMDDAFAGMMGWANGYIAQFKEGLAWPGWAVLSELCQRAEYRKISETVAREMVRKWIVLQSSGDEDKGDKIKALNDAFDKFKVRDVFRQAAEHDGLFGRGTVFIDTGYTDDADELAMPLILSEKKIPVGGLKGIRAIEPIWLYPQAYNSRDPLRDDFYKPQTWYCNGRAVHVSRLLQFVGRQVPDILKPSYQFSGISLSQMARPYVDNWLRARESVSDLLHSFSTMVLSTNMGAFLQGDGGDQMIYRAQVFNQTRDNRGLFMVDKETETLSNVSTPLGTLDHLQSQAQEQLASVSGIPLIKLLGISPAGLNASSEGELMVFYDTIHAYQEHLFGANLEKLLKIMQLHLFGDIDPDIGYRFEPLWQLNEAERATTFKTYADAAVGYIQAGVLHPADERQRLADTEDSPYRGIDVNDLPDPPPDLVGEPDDDDDGSDNPQNAKGEPDNAEFKGEA